MKYARTSPDTKTSAEFAAALLFGFAVCLSWGYCLVTGGFNGDFFGSAVYLSEISLGAIMVASLLPYVVTWQLYKRIRKTTTRVPIVVSQRVLNCVLLSTFAWAMLVTKAYGVGIMGAEIYRAPAGVQVLIQISNRLDPFYVAVVYILASPRKAKFDLLAIALMIALGLMRSGLGAFIYVALALGCKYYYKISYSKRTLIILFTILGLVIPSVTGALYGLRSQLRNEKTAELTIVDLLFAKLVGRLSSYSNSAYIIQEDRSLSFSEQQLDALYFPKQILGVSVHSVFLPKTTPEKILILSDGSDFSLGSFMAGIPGNMWMAFRRSPFVPVLNAILLLLLVSLTLRISNCFANPLVAKSGFLLLLYPLTSGVASEFGNLLVTLVLLAVVFRIFRPRAHAKSGISPSIPGRLSC